MPTTDMALAPVCALILAAPPNEPTDLYLMGSAVDRVELSWRIPFNNGAGEREIRVCLALFRNTCMPCPLPFNNGAGESEIRVCLALSVHTLVFLLPPPRARRLVHES